MEKFSIEKAENEATEMQKIIKDGKATNYSEAELIFNQDTSIEQNKIKDDHEHVVDVESPEVKEKIEEAKELFRSFYEKFQNNFDLSDPEKIQEVIQAAEKERIFEKAKKIRKIIYSNNISIYGVCYLSDICNQNCKFCPMGEMNYEKWLSQLHLSRVKKTLDEKVTNKGTKREEYLDAIVEKKLEQKIDNLSKRFKSLSPEDASRDIDAVVNAGHHEICILAGEEIAINPVLVRQYTQIALDKPGVKEVILNMVTYNERLLKLLRNGLKIPQGVKLQHRIFQETYDREEYAFYMERSPQIHGSKRDFDFRYNSQVAALKAGFDEVGIGALFGLSRFPMKEIAGLQNHTDYIKKETGKEPKRCCLPIANQPDKEHPVTIKYMISGMKNEKKITELIYALSRLAMPTVSIVSSERDNPETLEILDQYANHSTLFVHPAPGENIKSSDELQESQEKQTIKPIGQSETFPRKPADALKSWKVRGYNILDFDIEKYKI